MEDEEEEDAKRIGQGGGEKGLKDTRIEHGCQTSGGRKKVQFEDSGKGVNKEPSGQAEEGDR